MKTILPLTVAAAFVLLLTPARGGITIAEGVNLADFPSPASPTPYTLTSGTNTFSGSVNSSNDLQDAFNVIVPVGFQILSVSKTATGGSFDGFVSFNGESISGLGTANFTGAGATPYPLNAGTYSALVAADFSTGTTWTITINLAPLPDYSITTGSGTMTITDNSGNSDTLAISEPSSGNILFTTPTSPSRTFRVNANTTTGTGNSGTITLIGISTVQVNAGAGDDTINVSNFTNASMSSLSIDGGTGNNTINFNGNLTFATNDYLSVDGDATTINVASNAQIKAKGSGTITLVASRNVQVSSGALLQTTTGAIDIEGNSGFATSGNFVGVSLSGASVQTTSGGVTIVGQGGNDSSGSQIGVQVTGVAKVQGGSAVVSISGTGGGTAGSGSNQGLELTGNGSQITATTGKIFVVGVAGFGSSSGIHVVTSASLSTPAGGSDINLTADTMTIDATAQVSTAAASASVFLAPNTQIGIDLGGAAPGGMLSLSDALLDRITTANLVIGGTTGAAMLTPSITTSAAVSPANATAVTLQAGAIYPTFSGTDIAVANSGALNLQGPPIYAITGTSGYPQLTVAGTVNLNNEPLTLTGTTYTGTVGDSFTLVSSSGITGTFNGLPEGSYFLWPTSSALAAQITYAGGSGHNVVVTLVTLAQALTVSSTGDTGPGTLRAAMALAASHTGSDTVTFSSGLGGPVHLTSAIAVNDAAGVTIDASAVAGGVTITGGGTGGSYRLFNVASGSSLTLRNLTLSNGGGSGLAANGGAIDNSGTLNLTLCTLTGNSAPARIGGAIENEASGMATFTQCTFSGNSVDGGGIGGAVDNHGNASAISCTFSSNSASFGFGGAISNFTSLTLTQCTFSGNSTATGSGAALANNGNITLTHCTVSGNTAGNVGGGIDNLNVGTITLNNTIIAGNSASGGNPDIAENGGAITRVGANLVGNNSSVTTQFPAGPPNANGDYVGTAASPLNAKLGSLVANGGPTQTMALLTGSPALDAVPSGAIVAGLTLDQRGFLRKRDGNGDGIALPDIGAFEAQATPLVSGQIQVFVTTALDENDPNGTLGTGLSLRELLRDASPSSAILIDPAFPGNTILLGGTQLEVSKNVTIDASSFPSGITVSGNVSSRVIHVQAGVTAAFNRLNIASGDVGGAFPNGYGAGLYNEGTLTLTECSLTSNTAFVGGAAFTPASANLTLNRCTVSGNAASYGAGLQAEGPLTATACTFNNNNVSNQGGAVDAPFNAASLTHCTISGNSAGSGGGVYTGSTLTLSDCIVAGNSSGDGLDIRNNGTLTLVGTSLVQGLAGNAATGSGTIVNAAPLLAPLGGYGGPTQTMALLIGSPARDAATGPAPSVDQRNLAIADGHPDIGAYEAGIFANYYAWIYEKLPASTANNAALHAPTSDFDNDGSSNLLEYATLTDPLLSTGGTIPNFTLNAGHTTGTISFPVRLSATDLFYTLQRSFDLTNANNWITVATVNSATHQVLTFGGATASGSSVIIVTDPNVAGHAKIFYQLKVTQQ